MARRAKASRSGVEDKLRIARKLDEFGIDYIEGGWPGSNPKDSEFFHRARDLTFGHARLAAFGSTRRAGVAAEEDEELRTLLEAETPVITLFGKSWTLHVTEALRTTLEENLRDDRSIACAYLKARARKSSTTPSISLTATSRPRVRAGDARRGPTGGR